MADTTDRTTTSAYDQVQFGDEQLRYLKSIDATTREILIHATGMSQSDARNYRSDSGSEYKRVNRSSRFKAGSRTGFGFGSRSRYSSVVDDFVDSFEKTIIDSVVGSDFKKKVGNALNAFADGLGVQLEDVPKELGKELGKQALNAFKNTQLGKEFSKRFEAAKKRIISEAANRFKQGAQGYDRAHGTDFWSKMSQSYAKRAAGQAASNAAAGASANAGQDVTALVAKVVGSSSSSATASNLPVVSEALVSGATNAGAALSGLGSMIGPLVASLGPLLLVVGAVYVAFKVLEPAIEGTIKLFKAVGKSASRDKESRKQNLKYEQERLTADVHALIEAPFEILKESAKRVEEAWDNSIRKINQTQGYSKADLQDLMAVYAARLRSENLASVVGGSDIINNLTKVLDAGLSGAVAEEFAYVATILNAAVPTQDFFSYAEEYAALAANQVASGKSQSEAIADATNQLKSFASNIVYANRELAGGFTSGLKDASSLFKDAVVISQAARTGDISQISGVLASVSAIVGAVAPDLVSEIVGSITKAATGGNASEIVALRSMAGINASNTEFLRRFAADPQAVFSAVFSGLAQKQRMAPGAYMEVAEGLSSIFGLSIDALSRVDFQYLADAVSSMNVNNAALDENLALLVSGESTTNAELHRLAQVNEYMVNEGLALVLDNEVGRSIQEHMWQEQTARELMEAEYGVNLHGAALEFLEGIKNTVNNVLTFLNPLGWIFGAINKIANVIQTAAEARGQEADIRQALMLGAVGGGDMASMYRLTTRNQDLNLTRSYISMLGGLSAYETAHTLGSVVHALNISNLGTTLGDANDAARGLIRSALLTGVTAGASLLSETGRSKYSWGMVGKRQAAVISGLSKGSNLLGTASSDILISAAQATTSRFDEWLAQMESVAEKGETYNDWIALAKGYSIADVLAAAEERGYTESQLQDMFSGQSSKAAGQKEAERKKQEDEFWATSIDYESKWMDEWQPALEKHIVHISTTLGNFYQEWMKYFVEHKVYNEALNLDQSKIAKIRSDENSELSESVYELARAFLGADSKDPRIQTNALLSQILMILNVLMQQGNKSPDGLTLFDTYAALATGLYGSR